MPMRDAARAACVSRAFLRSWRCHPNLTFSDTTLGMNKNTSGNDEIARDFSSEVDQILRNHSGIGVKKLKIHMFKYCNAKVSCYLNSWLQIAVTPGIEELPVTLPRETEYNFPCSLLSNGSGDSIRCLHLAGCSLGPTAELAWLKSLTKMPSMQFFCFGAIGNKVPWWDSFLQDPLHASAAQVPRDCLLLPATSD